MKVENKNVKRYIFDIINFEDALDEKNQPIKRTAFIKEHYSGAVGAKKKIANSMEVAMVSADLFNQLVAEKREMLTEDEQKEVEWVKAGDIKEGEARKIISERFTDEAIDFDNKEKKAIKYYFDLTNTVKDYDAEAFDKLTELLK